MADDVLTRPLVQVGDFTLKPPRKFTLPFPGWLQICEPDVNRFAFVITPDTCGPLSVSPIAKGSRAAAFSVDLPTLPTVVHASVFPLWVTGVWYACTGSAGDCWVQELVRTSGG